MKQTVTNLNGSNESISYFSTHIEHFTFDILFGYFPTNASPIENVQNQLQITHVTFAPFFGTVVHDVYNISTNFRIDPIAWTLFFMDPGLNMGLVRVVS